ncbi:MAG: NADH-quinone oxidoreductase subunit NuoH [Candidatus Brocadiales bacterium]
MEFLYDTEKLIDAIYNVLQSLFLHYHIPLSLLHLLIPVISIGLILMFISVNAMFLVWLERKVSAQIQVRLGPMRVGWQGILQPIADSIKLILKEGTTPKAADKWIYYISPIIVFTSAVMVYVTIPWSPGAIMRDLNMGILYIFAATSMGVLGILMAGWSSNNKYTLLGGLRSSAQVISYEFPMTLSVIGVIMIAQTLSMTKIVEHQSGLWYIILQPLGFVLYIVSATAEVNRAPLDLPEAESELVAGFHTEYSGIRFAMFFLAEYTNMFAISAIATVLFLGGWNGPILPPIMWFFLKTYSIVLLLMWVRWTFPRVRVDQLMSFSWKFLIPLAFLNIGLTGIFVVVFT